MPTNVVTIGNFDGVHLGHREILARARKVAGAFNDGRVVALAFYPHPATLLRPDLAPPQLTTFAQRERLLLDAGADEVVRIEPTPDLLALEPADYVQRVVDRYAPRAIVEGHDFRFGRGRAGDVTTLRSLGERLGFEAHTVEPFDVHMTDQLLVRASSTHARWLVEGGRVGDAALVLGRPYALTGEVVRGDQRGRQIGCPTANLRTPNLLPADGVYAGIASLADGAEFTAAIHIGPRDTFDQPERVVEAHLLDWAGPNLSASEPEYGWPLTLELTAWLRDLARFDGIEPLMAQITRDIDRARELCGRAAV